MKKYSAIVLIFSLLVISLIVSAQQQISGGGSTNLVQIGGTNFTIGQKAMSASMPVVLSSDQSAIPITAGTLTVTGTGGTFPISGSIGNTAFGVSAGIANIGITRSVPSSCTQSTNFTNSTVGVATGAGTSVTSTTTCVTNAYANNTTNSPVTLRLADKQGTPVIWFGGNADYTIPANSNINIPLDGVIFTSGITAIAGTAAAINLQINGLQ